jgi:hypothetical protein
MQRTIDDYDSMARREMIKAKQEKAQMHVPGYQVHYFEPCLLIMRHMLTGVYKSSEQTMPILRVNLKD